MHPDSPVHGSGVHSLLETAGDTPHAVPRHGRLHAEELNLLDERRQHDQRDSDEGVPGYMGTFNL